MLSNIWLASVMNLHFSKQAEDFIKDVDAKVSFVYTLVNL